MNDPAPRWPLPGAVGLRDALLSAYGDPGRRYHDLRHLGEVLDRLTELSAAGERFDPLTVTLAAWFHDGVHERGGDDERRSADWAKQSLVDLGDDGPGPGVAAEVARLVLLTTDHRAGEGDRDGAALCDADLAILASGGRRYREYAADVRAEWSHVSDDDFARGRSAVLGDLLDRPVLFATSHGRRFWERPARANVAAELSALA